MPAVSVLMPCYNARTTLDEALLSLKGQTLTDFEIVAVNDGSEDGSGQALRAWEKREPRLRVLHQKHAGIIAALNAGLAACRGQYVARLDSDDTCAPERLERQAALLDARPDITVVGCLVSAFPEGAVQEGMRLYLEWMNGLVTHEQIQREIFVESPFAHPSVMFRKAAVLRVGSYQEHGWPEDYDLWLRLYLAGAGFGKVPEVLVNWRERPDRLTRRDARYGQRNFLRAKAHYLACGPLNNQAAIIWGAGPIGRRMGKLLNAEGVTVLAHMDVDERKVGRTKHGKPVLSIDEGLSLRQRSLPCIILAAVGVRGARAEIRQRLADFGLCEGRDWWSVI